MRDLYRVDPRTAETLGNRPGTARFRTGASRRTEADPVTGELLFFSYSMEAPYLRYGAVDKDGNLMHLTDVGSCPGRACRTIWPTPKTT